MHRIGKAGQVKIRFAVMLSDIAEGKGRDGIGMGAFLLGNACQKIVKFRDDIIHFFLSAGHIQKIFHGFSL